MKVGKGSLAVIGRDGSDCLLPDSKPDIRGALPPMTASGRFLPLVPRPHARPSGWSKPPAFLAIAVQDDSYMQPRCTEGFRRLRSAHHVEAADLCWAADTCQGASCLSHP